MFVSQAILFGDRVLYRFYQKGHWQFFTWEEVLSEVRKISLGLISLGVKKGDRVAIYAANRVEWCLIDWASICIGALTVPVYSSSTPNQACRVIELSGSTILFVDQLRRWEKMDPSHPSIRQIKETIVMESQEQPELSGEERSLRVHSLDRLRVVGEELGQKDGEIFDRRVSSLGPEDDLTIICTSGTTGEPKGVLTTHGHYLFMIEACSPVISSSDDEVTLQFLPLAHSFGRLEHFMAVAKGYSCGFARSIETVANDLKVIQPTLLFSVPRIYENAHKRILSRVAAGSALGRFFFRWGLSVGRRFSRYQMEGLKTPLTLRLARYLAYRLVFSKIHQSFGGKLRMAISGGAPLDSEIGEFFHAVGILIVEGYGLTESSTVSHANRAGRNKFGTVGLPLAGVECRIASDGEVLLRGPNIFKCYYRDSDATREVLGADGWFRTGDVGEIDPEGFLRITDRKKDLIVTSGGKKVAPQMIENLLKADPLVSQAMVLGDRSSHLVALITLDQDKIFELRERERLEFANLEEAVSYPRVISIIGERIRQMNKGLAPFEAVRGFRLLPQDFTLGTGELTPTLKLKRQVVMERHSGIIEEMTRKPRVEI